MSKLEDIGKVNDLIIVNQVYPYVESEVLAMVKSVEARTFAKIEKGELTPEAAMAAWMEKLAYVRLLKRFKTRKAIGVSAAEQVYGKAELDN